MRNTGYRALTGAGILLLLIVGGPGVASAQAPTPKAEAEVDMQAQDWNRLDDVADQLAGLQAKLSTEIPMALAQAQKRVIEISPEADFEFAGEPGGWLGLEISEVNADSAKELTLPALRGVQVTNVESDSPGAKAGLKDKDVILTYEGQNIEGTVQFRRMVRETPPGRTIPLGVFRDGSMQTVNIEVAERGETMRKVFERRIEDNEQPRAFEMPNLAYNFVTPMPDLVDAHTPLLGIAAEDLSGQLGSYFGAPNGEGVLVREVKTGTPADKAGVKAGDVITSVDDKAVKSLHDLRSQLREKRDQKSVNLSIVRKGSEIKVPIAIEKPKPMEAPQVLHRAQL
jgi:serine protease Do